MSVALAVQLGTGGTRSLTWQPAGPSGETVRPGGPIALLPGDRRADSSTVARLEEVETAGRFVIGGGPAVVYFYV